MVLVSHTAKFIYMKTHKTAGTTVEMYFERFCVPEGTLPGTEAVPQTVTETGVVGSRREGKRRNDTWRNHMPAAEVRRLVGGETWRDYLKFATVRNPYAVVLSSFFWRNARPYPDGEAALARTRQEFAAFVRGRPLRGRRWSNDAEIVGIDGALQMDMLIRQEHLAADTRAVCERLDLPWTPERLVHAKKTAGSPPVYPLQDFYTPETAAIVRREFDWVFSRLDYGLPQ